VSLRGGSDEASAAQLLRALQPLLLEAAALVALLDKGMPACTAWQLVTVSFLPVGLQSKEVDSDVPARWLVSSAVSEE
jgi:hypothetical protein